jgi:hypothetical protein
MTLTMTQYELDVQRSAKIALQEQRLRESKQQTATLIQTKKQDSSSLPASELKLRPTYQDMQAKQRLTREDILRLSRTLRHTHQPNLLVLRFDWSGRLLDEDQDKKFRATAKLLRQRQLDKKYHLQHVAAAEEYEHEHHLTPFGK